MRLRMKLQGDTVVEAGEIKIFRNPGIARIEAQYVSIWNGECHIYADKIQFSLDNLVELKKYHGEEHTGEFENVFVYDPVSTKNFSYWHRVCDRLSERFPIEDSELMQAARERQASFSTVLVDSEE